MSLPQLIRILWVRKVLLLSVMSGAILLALAANFFMSKSYVAEAAVVIDLNGGDPLKDDALSSQSQQAYIATQADVMRSHNVAVKVVDQQKLLDDPAVAESFEKATDLPASPANKGVIRDWLAEILLNKINVRIPNSSNVVYLEYTAGTPQKAAALANAFANSYLQTSVELKVDPAQRQAGWFEQQVQGLRKNLEDAQTKLSAYQSAHGVIGTDESKLDVENARLADISNQLVTAQTAMYQATAREQQLNDAVASNRVDELADLLKNPVLQNLKTELARVESKFAEMSQRFDRNHPEYIAAAAERDSLQKKLAAEINNVKGTIGREASIARQQAAQLQQSLDQQRNRILSLKHDQDEYAVLKRDVESVRGAYDAALQRTSQSQLVSRLDHSNVAILNYATAPTAPASPRPVLNLALAVILGFMLGAGLILMQELFDRRVRSRDDLLQGMQLAVLAELPKALRLKADPPRRRPPQLKAVAGRGTSSALKPEPA